MRTDVDHVKLTIAADGTATLTGISYDDLRSLFTAASLHRHDHPAKATPLDGSLDEVQHENNLDTFKWHEDQRLLLDILNSQMQSAISPGSGSDVSTMKSMHAFNIANLEHTVCAAEAMAAAKKASQAPDLIGEAAADIAKAIRDADSALAKLNHARQG